MQVSHRIDAAEEVSTVTSPCSFAYDPPKKKNGQPICSMLAGSNMVLLSNSFDEVQNFKNGLLGHLSDRANKTGSSGVWEAQFLHGTYQYVDLHRTVSFHSRYDVLPRAFI